mmetsp:Transcript_29802/g.78487  ORF Transcript_29802/g.78487 Transcript_29802/m.78487 type:complete len:109 (+) Transcript_29802:90-416(+)
MASQRLKSPCLFRAAFLLSLTRLLPALGAAESPDDCINVEEPGYAGGDRQCFSHDDVGMVCGWDGTDQEAYCEVSAAGLKVCARRRGGGRCKEGNRQPATGKSHDREL